MRALKKGLLVAAALMVTLVAVGLALYAGNAAPAVAPVTPADLAGSRKPIVVKVHAQWCPVCMVTKDVWSQIEATYSSRVHLVVLDFTNEANSASSRAEARRLGLNTLLDEYDGATGTIVVVDGRTKDVVSSIQGSRAFAEYRAAIDAALNTSN